MLRIVRLTVEDLESGCVTDQRVPHFSFILNSDKKDVYLEQAELSVGNWKTVVTSQIMIPYEGPALQPFSEYFVRIKAIDNTGETAEAETRFETGRFGTNWKGKWITDVSYVFKEKRTSPVPMMFQKRIRFDKRIKSAKFYITAIGIYELTLNGVKVGNDYFAPGLTSYKHVLQYQVYDVTKMLQIENEICATVSGGWAVGSFTMKRTNRITAPRQALLAELRILYEDGSAETIGTNESWNVTTNSNLRYADFYDGEIFDASMNDKDIIWRQAGCETVNIHPKLIATYGTLVHAHEEMKPCNCVRDANGMLIFDFGQNFAGVIRARIKGKKGQQITFRHSEVLVNNELYLQPLRTAKASVIYTCADGEQEYSPKMTYMGFRYVGVIGIDEKDIELSAIALYSDLQDPGKFECSNELITRLQKNICWSTKSNFLDIPTDCPQRDERMGWTGDIALFSPTACSNFNVHRFLNKWLKDVKAEQRPLGGINVVIPEQGFRYPFAVVAYWGDCCILVPWAMYQFYGDTVILQKMYPVMKKYLSAVKFWAGVGCVGRTNRHTWRLWHQYGDWVAPDTSMWACMNRGLWTATACWSNSCRIVADIARILGEKEDEIYFSNLKKEIDRAYVKRFISNTGKMKYKLGPMTRQALGKDKEFQSGYVLPLAFGMLKPEMAEKVLDNLIRMIKESDYHIKTGFPGTPYILFALADNGREEEAYKMLLQDTCPSWLYEARYGTTIWERWDAIREDGTFNDGKEDGTNGMTSFNHYASGSVGNFLYSRIAGIRIEEGGYKEFEIKPVIGGNISYARGNVFTPYGRIESSWKIEDGHFSINIEVPVGTTCHLTLPGGERKTIGSGKYSF